MSKHHQGTRTSADLHLHPICDSRGELSQVLSGQTRCSTRSDALLFAWILDLPSRVPVELAATSMLTVSDSRTGERAQLTADQVALRLELRSISRRRRRGGLSALARRFGKRR